MMTKDLGNIPVYENPMMIMRKQTNVLYKGATTGVVCGVLDVRMMQEKFAYLTTFSNHRQGCFCTYSDGCSLSECILT